MLIICLAMVGCAGFRSGVVSAPYVGEVEPVPTHAETDCSGFHKLMEIQLPGVKLDISLNNKIRTSDLQVMLFFVPMFFDPRDKPYFKETDRLTVSLKIIPADSDFVFDPSGVTVTVNGHEFSPTTTRLDDLAKWYNYRKSGSPASGDPTLWSDLVDKEIALIKDKRYNFTIIFNCPVPTPEKSIRLDIGRALRNQRLPNIPTIRFMKSQWKECYT
jgi:hypothetical protein